MNNSKEGMKMSIQQAVNADVLERLSPPSTGTVIQHSVTSVIVGLLMGSTIKACFPDPSVCASSAMTALEAFAQVAVNGILVGAYASRLDSDPTFGLPFSLGLFEAQPNMKKRLKLLAGIATQQVGRFGQQTLLPMVEAPPPNQGSGPSPPM